ncbi:MAG: DUF4411 family protein [Anaerolineaceae bacterium]|nr:DUF4411 family protein [Anaerolineaceae bacterium]
MRFCIDSSVYITAQRTYYAFDIAESFWNALEDLATNKIILSPIAAYIEIQKGKDQLAEWTKIWKKELFIEPDFNVNRELTKVADYVNTNYMDQHWISDFLSGADPWVIAQASAHNLIVVTMENQKSSEERDKTINKIRGKIKIPNVCAQFDVQCITTFEFMRENNIKL